MALVITHATVASDPQVPLLGATEWNENHTLTGSIAWGEITGDITDQTDLQTALSDYVSNADYTPAHSILVQQSGTGTPTALSIGNNTLVGRLSGGGSNIDDLSASDVRTLLSISNVDNTSDANKPVSTATQTALDLKANLASPTFTGTVTLPAGQVVNGVTLTTAGGTSNFLRADGTYAAPPGAVAMSFGAITTTSSSDGTNYSAVTGSNVTVTAGKTYRIRWRLRTYSAANTTGIALRRVLTTAVGTVYGLHYRGLSNASAVTAQSSREGTNDPFVGTGNATSSTTASGSYDVETLFSCTTSGTFGLEMRSEVNTSLATIDGDGSYWVAEEWNT